MVNCMNWSTLGLVFNLLGKLWHGYCTVYGDDDDAPGILFGLSLRCYTLTD